MGDAEIDWAAMPSNVTYCGGFSSPDELPLGEVMAFLYTSRFDGMPNVVLEVGARGVPIVCPRVGGIGDFLGGDWPFYVSTPQDIEGYVAGLARLRDDAGVWRAASERLVSLAREDRSVGQFRRAIAGLLPAERHSGEWT
jgi:glycosyltransferase involved in cell wall biosynthesis